MPQPDPIPELKVAAAAALARRIAHWSSAYDAAAALCTDRSRIYDIRQGRLTRFSLEMLLRLLVRAGARVELRILDPTFRARDRATVIDAE
ncbi:MAG TPA: XRE family transcriptional regulator [Gemmatimonadaceae bacterium]|nr:XRE family transcriptional regulator [Gemmatimonadaceae bacterium]